MTLNIGVFEQEEAVMEAIRRLQDYGLGHSDIRVIVKNAESAPLLTSQADVPIEDLQDIEEARQRLDGGVRTPIVGLAGNLAGDMGTGTLTGYQGVGGGFIATNGFEGEDGDGGRLLREIGIPDKVARRCEDEVGSGRYLLLAESGDESAAPTIIRGAGAVDVLH